MHLNQEVNNSYLRFCLPGIVFILAGPLGDNVLPQGNIKFHSFEQGDTLVTHFTALPRAHCASKPTQKGLPLATYNPTFNM